MANRPKSNVPHEHYPGWPEKLHPGARKQLEAAITELLDEGKEPELIERLWRLGMPREKTPKPVLGDASRRRKLTRR